MPETGGQQECEWAVSIQSTYIAGCISCGAPCESFFWSGTADSGFRVQGVSEINMGFAFSLLVFAGASQQRKALKSHVGEASSFADSMQHSFLQCYHPLP